MNKKPFNICSIPHYKFDEFWIEMEACNNVCRDVKADKNRYGNVLVRVVPSRRQTPQRGPVGIAFRRMSQALGEQK